MLHELLRQAAARWGSRTAVEDARGSVGYAELDAASDRLAARLGEAGVRPGDRVLVALPKSIAAVTAIFGALKAGAAYVPIDPEGPVERNRQIADRAAARARIDEAGVTALEPDAAAPGTPELAMLLFTSGSTGRPKGVMISHRAAGSFVAWARETFAPTADDRFSSLAPLHFDLSVFDLFVSIASGGTVVLFGEAETKNPRALAAAAAERRISIWYSVPSVLRLMTEHGQLERHAVPSLRLVLFAGEVYPVPHLRALMEKWPAPRYFNLYGPTETNVCTFFEVARPLAGEPLPIGRACAHVRTRVAGADDRPVPRGEVGQLQVAGAPLMSGYFGEPEATAAALFDDAGQRWYRTGDFVVERPDGQYLFVGRRDRMVKRHGYRIELDEIEAALLRHPAVREAAVYALPEEDAGVRIVAALSCADGGPSIIELRGFSATVLPRSHVPDRFELHPQLPRTATGKMDYPKLQEGR